VELKMLKLKTSPGASVRGSHPLKGAKGGAASVVVMQARKGWASPPFQKKSKRGIATPQKDLELIRQRLSEADRVHRARQN
jgi:hypothetical protein